MAPLVVEFIGLPGAGKTMIAQNVIEELVGRGYRCFGLSTLSTPEGIEKKSGSLFSKLRTLYHFIVSCVMYGRFVANGFMYTLRVNPFSLVSLRRFFILIVRFHFIKTVMVENYDLLILDQGPIQNVWSITTTGKRPNGGSYLEPLLKSLLDEFSPLLVMVDIDSDLAYERISKRPTMRSRFDRMSPSMAKAILAEHGKLFDRLADLASTIRNSSHLSVHGNRPVQENVEIIVPYVEQVWNARNA